MMDVVVPLSVVNARPTIRPVQIAGLIAVVLKYEMNFAVADTAADPLGNLAENVGLALVEYRVDGVEAEPVEVELFEPVESVVHEKIAYRPAIRPREVDRGTPWRPKAVVKEIGCDRRQIVTLWPEVVVDHIEKDGETARVARLHEPLQIVGPAVLGS